MKRLIILALIAMAAAPAMAAQTDITTISSVTATREALRIAVNGKLSGIDSNFDELYTAIGTRPWVAQATAPADTTLIWFDTDQVADKVVLKLYVSGAWKEHAIGEAGTAYSLPAATALDLGGVKDGAGVTIAGDGTISADLQTVGDCTGGPCLDGSPDGGSLIKMWAGTGSYWTALQGGAPAANRSWRLPIAPPPAAGATQLMLVDEYGNMGFLPITDTTGKVLSQTTAGVYSWIANGSGGSMTWPASDGEYYASKDGTWASLTGLYQGADADLTSASGASAAGNSKYWGTNSGGVVGFYDLPSGSGAPSWLPATGPTSDNQIIQATGAGTSAWTSIVDGLINDAGNSTDDLLSASEINTRITAKVAAINFTAPGPIGSVTPNTGAFTTLVANSFDFSAPDTGETGEIGFQEDPANGNNTVTLKAPASLAGDLVITLPTGAVPASATSTCTAGQWWYNASYWYVCVATNTWRRAALSTW